VGVGIDHQITSSFFTVLFLHRLCHENLTLIPILLIEYHVEEFEQPVSRLASDITVGA
jgi:hypothetical protein